MEHGTEYDTKNGVASGFPHSFTVTFTYALGRLRTSNDPNGTLTYSYDAAGRRTALTSSSGYAMRTVYDDAGRPAMVYEGTGTAEKLVATYAYSVTSGRLERVERFDSTTTSTYDALGRMTQRVPPPAHDQRCLCGA